MNHVKHKLYYFFHGVLFCLISIFLVQQIINFFAEKNQKEESTQSQLSFQKIEEMYDLILSTYYEPLDTTKLLNSMLDSMLQNMDPHTSYIPSKEHIRQSEEMTGNFYGIGIQFNIFQDTIVVIKVLPNGPSAQTNLMPGDRITHVNEKKITGPNISNEEVLNRLRGKQGTVVKLTVLSPKKEQKNIELSRGEIPLNSIISSYVIEKNIGYLKMDKFSSTTYEEFINHANELTYNGAQKMIIDLRDNTGGYLDQAVAITDELLDFGLDIVSVKGNFRDQIMYTSTYQGQLSDYPLIILINNGSASASEILAGAIQDNDRGEIVGSPSFGKGLVGEEFSLGDGAVLRLTVAKYFTPSGRCIQKDITKHYDLLDPESTDSEIYTIIDQYYNEIDSTQIFYTLQGDTVYGGGGIHPDYNIPDKLMSKMSVDFIYNNFEKLDELTFQFIDAHRNKLQDNGDHFIEFLYNNEHILWELCIDAFKATHDLTTLNNMKNELQKQLAILSARNFLSTQEFVYFANKEDEVLKKAINLLKSENHDF